MFGLFINIIPLRMMPAKPSLHHENFHKCLKNCWLSKTRLVDAYPLSFWHIPLSVSMTSYRGHGSLEKLWALLISSLSDRKSYVQLSNQWKIWKYLSWSNAYENAKPNIRPHHAFYHLFPAHPSDAFFPTKTLWSGRTCRKWCKAIMIIY